MHSLSEEHHHIFMLLISKANEPLHRYHQCSSQSGSFQTTDSCGLLLKYNVSCCNAFLQHAVLEICGKGFTLEHNVDAVVSEVVCFGQGCLVVWKAQSLSWFHGERRI